MSESFGKIAVGHAGIAARLLGWRPADFWAATPAELAASLGLANPGATTTIARAELERMMDIDNGRSD